MLDDEDIDELRRNQASEATNVIARLGDQASGSPHARLTRP
ncbi:MAG TPA: hypothetical protein VIF57_16045 [Polyangia bacterium]|jgi:hypothetical protein